MFDYIKGTIFVILFICFLSALGKKIKKGSFFSENLVYGFVVYTCIQFVGGFIAQQFRLPWIYYQAYMIIALICLVLFILYKHKIEINKKILISHFKHYGIIYLIAIVFVVLACMNIQYQWNSNLVDDGYYLNKIRMAPYVENYVDYNFATGFSSPGSIIRNVNTFEIEAAFYSNILGMDASIYAKVFLALFNYTLVLNVIYWFYKTVLGKESKVRYVMVALVPVLFFGIYQELLVNFGILNMQDSWQFNTAMWYGSTFVRTAGLFILITPLLKTNKMNLQVVTFYVLSSIALLSKASQAFPIAVLIAIIYLLKYFIGYVKNKKVLLIATIIFIIILVVLPTVDYVDINLTVINLQIERNFGKFIVKICFFLMAVSYLLDIRVIKKWNNWLFLMAILMFVPKINTLFAYLCVYDFVAARTVSLFLFTLAVTSMLYAYLIVIKVIQSTKKIIILYTVAAVSLVAVPLISIQRNLGLMNTVRILIENPKLQPESTLELSKQLEKLKEEKQVELNVLMPMWVVSDGTPHPVSTMIRYNAFDINSIGAIARYNQMYEDSEFFNYGQEEQEIVEKYHSYEDQDDEKIEKILSEYPVNCIVVYYDEVAERIQEQFGFSLISKVMLSDQSHHYYILFKE